MLGLSLRLVHSLRRLWGNRELRLWVIGLKIVFRSFVGRCPTGRCHSNQLLLALFTRLVRWTQAASGAAGRANVGLCRASSYAVLRRPCLSVRDHFSKTRCPCFTSLLVHVSPVHGLVLLSHDSVVYFSGCTGFRLHFVRTVTPGLERVADLHTAQLMPAATHCLLLQ